MREAGFTDIQLRCMSVETPARQFKVASHMPGTMRAVSSDSGAFGCDSSGRLDRGGTGRSGSGAHLQPPVRASGQNGPMIGVLPPTVVRRSTRRYLA